MRCEPREKPSFGKLSVGKLSFRLLVLLCALTGPVVLGPAVANAAQEAEGAAKLAAHVSELAGLSRGVCSVLGCGDGEVAAAFARREGFFIHVLDADKSRIDAARRALDEAGLYGVSAVAERMNLERLPYADNLVDLVVATCLTDGDLEELKVAEVLRVLRPLGKAIVGSTQKGELKAERLKGWLGGAGAPETRVVEDEFGVWAVLIKPAMPGVDAWSHWEHAPDNNPVSTDQAIKAPYMTQWLGEPFYIAMPAITTAAGGRVFLATGHIAHHDREEPWLNTLLACNGYNGTVLWELKFPDGYLAHRSAFIATPDVFYMIALDGKGVTMLDPETGEKIDEVRIRGLSGEWKWIAKDGDVLYALVGDKKDPAENTVVRSQYTHWSWGDLSKGYYTPRVPWGFGQKLLAYDLARKAVRWTHEEAQPVDSRAMAMGGGRLYFYGPDSHVGCLDVQTGKVVWTNPDPKLRALVEEEGRGLGSTPGFKTTCFALWTPKALFFEAQTRANVVAVALEDGRLMWHRKKTTNNPNMLYLEDKLLVGIGDNGLTQVLDPLTGKTEGELEKLRKRSCARLTATPDSLFCRGWPEGLTRYDRTSKQVVYDGSVRPSCNDGVVPANGLLYLGPWACDCNLSLMGRVVLCSAGDFKFDYQATDADRLDPGEGDITQVQPLPATERDWPTYRSSANRGASTRATVPDRATPIWRYKPARAFRPTAPTAAGGLVFVAGDDGRVRAIDAADGTVKWVFLTAGPVLQPPTIWEGRAYVGSGDGHIYALEAATGRMLWRFRAAPVERRIMAYGSLSSTWPVHTGVLVHDGVAYAAAGIIDYNGTYVYALDARTGKLIWQNNSSGHLDKHLRKGASAQGVLTVAGGRLWMAAGNVVSPAAYDLKSGQYVGRGPGNGSPQANRGEEVAVFRDKCILVGGRLRFSATTNVVNPGRFDGMLIQPGQVAGLAHQVNGGKIPPAWDDARIVFVDGRSAIPASYDSGKMEAYLSSQDEKGKAQRPDPVWAAKWLNGKDTISLVAGPNAVVAVCTTPGHRSLAPSWSVCCSKADDGTKMWEASLPGEALPGSLLVDGEGRIIVVLADGGVACYGGMEQFRHFAKALESKNSQAGRQQAIQFLMDGVRNERDLAVRAYLVELLGQLGTDIGAEARKNGAITSYKLLGPVPWDPAKNPADKVFVDEPDVDVNRTYTIDGRKLGWQDYTLTSPDGAIDLYEVVSRKSNLAIYAYAEITLDKDQELLLKIGSDDGFKAWLNGKLVGRFDGDRGYVPDQDVLRVKGLKGVNKLLLKITQGEGGWAFGARLTDTSDKPMDLNAR